MPCDFCHNTATNRVESLADFTVAVCDQCLSEGLDSQLFDPDDTIVDLCPRRSILTGLPL
jgi:hypothetical protein